MRLYFVLTPSDQPKMSEEDIEAVGKFLSEHVPDVSVVFLDPGQTVVSAEQMENLGGEVKRLRMLVEGHEKAAALTAKGMESQCELMDDMKQDMRTAVNVLCCCPKGQDEGCGCRSLPLPELAMSVASERERLRRQVEGHAERIAAQSEEREACAALAERLDSETRSYSLGHFALDIAAAIRARSQP